MQTEVLLFKFLPTLTYFLSFFLSILAGLLVYTGLSSKEERVQQRIRVKQSLNIGKEKIVTEASRGKAEEWLAKAQYPLGLNGVRYNLFYWSILLFLTMYYVVFPVLIHNGITKRSIIAILVIILLGILASPRYPFTLFSFVMKRVIIYHQAKKDAEVFMLYDLLINEIEMMTNNRINTYNVLRNIKPYFTVLDKPFAKLLSSWGNDKGPRIALECFSQDLGSKEGESLVNVIKNLDELDRSTALKQLQGMNNMFTRSQIENYRRKRKVMTDLLGIPIHATHFVIILNFVLVIVMMVAVILQSSRL